MKENTIIYHLLQSGDFKPEMTLTIHSLMYEDADGWCFWSETSLLHQRKLHTGVSQLLAEKVSILVSISRYGDGEGFKWEISLLDWRPIASRWKYGDAQCFNNGNLDMESYNRAFSVKYVLWGFSLTLTFAPLSNFCPFFNTTFHVIV